MWKGQIFHRERVSAKSDLGCKKFYKDLMVSITPRIFYGFSPTTSSPHITAINSATSLRLLYYVSRVRQLLCGSLQIQYSARDGICTRRNIYTSFTFYCLRPIIQASEECCLRYFTQASTGILSAIYLFKFLRVLSPI